ncbi:MAG: efflux RND transporter permease subunit [Desulfobacterales bacterium]
MRSVVKFTIRQRVFLNVAFVIMVVAGAFSIVSIPVENMPMVDIGKVFIYTPYYGASAEDVEQLVTVEIEDALDDMESVEFIQSQSYRNFSSIQVKFIDDTDYKHLYDELRFRALNIKNELPVGAEEPRFVYIDTHIWLPVIVVNITGDIPQKSLRIYAEELKTQILNIHNVRSVDISGEFEREFHVSVDPVKLRKFGITFDQVASTIRSANTKIPTGRFRTERTEYMLDSGNRLSSQQEVLNVVVRRDGDSNFVRVKDLVTSTRQSNRDPSTIVSVNGENSLRLVVIKEDIGNAVTISEKVKDVAEQFGNRHLRDGIGIVFTRDSTFEINMSVKTLGGNLLLGMGLVVAVLWLTMGFRNAMLAAVGIPFSFLATITIMYLTGVTLNTISLFAFVLVTGIIVDDAIIIIENIFRHVQLGKNKIDAIVDGSAEVFLPVVASALTTVLAFLPMLIMTGSTGDFFAVIPKTVCFALFASVVEALFILPIHIFDWGPKPEYVVNNHAQIDRNDPFRHLQSGFFGYLWKIYRILIEKLLNQKVFTFSCVSAIFLVSTAILILSITGIMPLINVKFFPGNYFRYHVTIALPTGTAIEKTDLVVRDLSRFIMSLGAGQAQSASGTAGYYEDEDYVRRTGNNNGEVVVTLPEEKDRDFPYNPSNDPMKHLVYIREKIRDYVDKNYRDKELSPTVKIFEESDGPPTGKAVNIRVTALTMEKALDATDAILAYMKDTSELHDLMDLDDDRPGLQRNVKYVPNQEAVFEYGISPGHVIALVAGALNGQQAGTFRTIDEEIDLMVRVARKYDFANSGGEGLSGPLDVLDVPVVEHPVAPIMLRDLVDVVFDEEPNVKVRYKGEPTVTIMADIKPGSKLSPARVEFLVTDFFDKKKAEFLNTSLSFGGEFETTSKSYMSLTFAFFIALLGIYMVLASQFNDYLQPGIIISAVPFALIGVVMGLFLTRTTFTIGSFMAIVGLAGVSVNNSLLLIDFINVRIKMGHQLRDAIIEACAARIRPVVITTITTLLGLMPMAIGIPGKSISWAPMAMAFVSGLASSTVLTLLIVPVEYEALEKMKAFFKIGESGIV